MRRLFCLAIVGSAVAIGVGSAGAAPPETLHPGLSHIGGLVLPFNAASNGAVKASGAGQLQYHGGPVMHSNTVYTIFWNPPGGSSFATGYQGLIGTYFSDLQAAMTKGDQNNVYYTGTQYSDGAGSVPYSLLIGGTVSVADPIPSQYACSDSYTPNACVTDAGIQAEIQSVMSANGWTPGPGKEYFLFTAKGVGSCSGSQCAFSYYCAYHGYFGSSSNPTLYANMPYADTAPSQCDSGNRPNNNDADATINVTSHEQNETLTDQQLNAWYDRAGYEDGDKCAWKFGSVASDGSNQTINGHHYILQLEYSNRDRGCVAGGL